jgi:hypothetical protein
MAHDDDAKEYLAQRLEKPIGRRRYVNVKALILYWEESDKLEKYQEEAQQMEALFQSLHYETQLYQIRMDHSQLGLFRFIADYCIALNACMREGPYPSSLLIIHYGGHGDQDDDKHALDGPQERRAVWKA